MTDITTFPAFAAQLREFIQRHADSRGAETDDGAGSGFNQLAVSLFNLQFAHNRSYRQFCERRKIVPGTITNWRDIPAIPTPAFKEWQLTSLTREEQSRVFHSSGTTARAPGRHFHSETSLAIYEASLLAWFWPHFPNARSTAFLFLTPSPDAVSFSSLVHMFETVCREFGSRDVLFTGRAERDGVWSVDAEETVSYFRDSIAAKLPVTLFGTAFNFVHLLDHLAEAKQKFHLPSGSCVLETGGYKSRSRAMPKPELHALITDLLGVPATNIVCEYGMSELSSQAYDGIAGKAGDGARAFHFPPWARAQIINPENGREAGEGETGLIRIFDLANVYSVMAVQTEDLGVRRGDGFELLGRAVEVEARGCSLMSV